LGGEIGEINFFSAASESWQVVMFRFGSWYRPTLLHGIISMR